MPRKKTVEQIYQKKSPREHVLLRPDTYVGSVERGTEKMFVLDEQKMMMEEKDVEYVPALYKIFDEILVNAADNKQRDQSMKEIKIKIDIANGSVTIKNDGKGIPIEIHKEHDMYIPELIFGNLLTSSNYNDADLKTVGGRNGYGAKLANIFSKKFIVETVDSEQSKKYKQIWTNNMSKKGEPDITSLSSSRRNSDYTKVTFYPDFSRFNMTSFDNEDIVKLFIKRVFDIAGTTSKDLNVYLNIVESSDNDKYSMFDGRSALKIRTFIDYTKLFIGPNVKHKSDYFYFKDEKSNKWEIIFAISNDNEYRQISHVNNIWTIKGGTHVKYIENQFVKYFKDNFKDKQKKIKEMLKPKMIRDHLFIFVNSLIVNPAFSSQTKEILTTKSSQFGSKCTIPEDVNKRLMNKIKGIVKELLNFKLDQAAKKTDGKRKRRLNLPPEIDDANNAGTKHSSDCTLIVTEGLSAKTLAVAGITELPGSKNRFGIFPLKGKLLNVRDASRSQINKNNEINNLKQVLGLKHGIKYDNKKAISSLRYGKIMIMTDQDYDGSHIKGLMINLFHSEWPSLIQNKLFGKNGNESFIEQFITPIVVATKGKKKREAFYTVPQYEQWKKENNNGKGWKIKYYKGLGTWQRKEGKQHFAKLAEHRIAFKYRVNNNNFMNHNNNNNNNGNVENPNDLAIVKAFDKKKADLRKEWISSFDPENTFLDFTKLGINGRNKKVSYKDFIDKELILFSVNDLHRSVPSIYDGLKPGQRKILYCAFLKNNLKTEIRVAQLGGYVSEKSAYHHGETSLYQTIIGMAQDYVGSNNINLLSPNGMFGSRMRGGKDAASPRYIHTNLAKITRKLFVNHDDMIVKYQQDDGYPVEPEYYVPIIPMVLINGALGIGTGWSTFIPNYNPKDIIRNIRRKLSGEQWEIIHPFYRGFKGEIKVQTNDDMVNTYSYKIHGKAEIINTFTDNNTNIQYSTIQISELPIQQWTENYKKFLMDLEETEQIENLNNMSSDIDVAFTFDIQHKVKPTKTTKGGRGRKKEKDNDQQSISGSNSVSSSPTRNGPNNNKKSKKKIYFNGTLTDQFLKDMKLITSMSLTNMVLFDINGKIKRYDNVCQILQEFYEGRLSHYSLRKKALLNSMEHQLKKISNQARFIMMIIDDKLVISKRKKFDVIRDLRDHKFDTWIPSKDDGNTLRNRAKATDAFQDDDNNDGDNANDNDKMDIDTDNDKNELKRLAEGYKYLLSMSISSLTKEKVDDLLQKQEETTAKVNELKLKSAKDLWRDDLDQLDIHLKQYDETYKQNIEQMRKDAELKRNKANKNNTNNKTTKGRGRGKRKTTKATASKSKSKSQSKSQSKSKSPTTKTSKITSKVTKNTNSKKKKKKLLSDNNYPSDPFSMAKRNGQKSKSTTKSKSLSNNNYNTIDDDDFDSDQSPSPHISLFERANLKRNSPQKTRKRKRKLLDSSDDESQTDNDNDLEMMEPPRKKRNTLSVASSISSSPSSSSKTSSSKLPLKSKSLNKQKKNKGYDSLDDEYDINDDEDEDEDEDIVRKKRRTSPRRTKRNTTKAKYIDDDSEEEDEDEESEYNEENYSRNTRLKKKKTASVDSDSEYNLDLDEDDLELDEDDDDYSDY